MKYAQSELTRSVLKALNVALEVSKTDEPVMGLNTKEFVKILDLVERIKGEILDIRLTAIEE